MISLDLTKSPEVRKAGDQSKCLKRRVNLSEQWSNSFQTLIFHASTYC